MDTSSLCYLVTGGAGFIGSNFVRRLYKQGVPREVRVLDKLTYSGNRENLKDLEGREGFRFVEGDICDEKIVAEVMKGVDVVVNFAAEAAVDRSINESLSFLETDVKGVYVLLEAARKEKVLKKFIQISTDEVYGEIREGSFREDAELKPRNPYAASKLGGDRLAYSFFVTYGMPVVITRASNNYGPWAYPEKVIPLFITNLLEGKKVPLYGEGLQVRDWLHVEDHCRGIQLLVEKGKNGEVYNIGADEELSNLDLTQRILKLLGKGEEEIHYVQDRPGHDFRYSLNCEKLCQLGWKPEYDIATGLAEAVQWYQEHPQWWKPLKEKMEQRYITGFWGEKS